MSEPFIAEIRMFGGNFAPRGWALCNGQLLSIAQNTALFSILGTFYGGNGQTTFALPDLRGRVPMHPGEGPGLSPRALGEAGGSETVALTANQMPAHTHALFGSTNTASATTPTNTVLGTPARPAYVGGSPDTTLSPTTLGVAGGSQPHNNLPPFTCINYIIALEGIFPSRN